MVTPELTLSLAYSLEKITTIKFWKSVQVIEQKHKSNYNRLHFLI